MVMFQNYLEWLGLHWLMYFNLGPMALFLDGDQYLGLTHEFDFDRLLVFLPSPNQKQQIRKKFWL